MKRHREHNGSFKKFRLISKISWTFLLKKCIFFQCFKHTDEPHISPRRHNEKWLIFRNRVERVQHFNNYKHRKRKGHRVGIGENRAIDSLKVFRLSTTLHVISQLPPGHLRSFWWKEEPPGSSSDGSRTNVDTNNSIANQKPRWD